MSAPESPSGPSPATKRLLILGVLGVGLCALFLGVFAETKPKAPDTPGDTPPGHTPGATHPPGVRLQGIEAVRTLARTVRELRVKTGNVETALGMARVGMDRIFPGDQAGARALLLEALGDPSPEVQWVACSALLRYGPVDARLVKILLVRSLDENELVRDASTEALASIRVAEADGYRLLFGALDDAEGARWAAIARAIVNTRADRRFKVRLIPALTSEDVLVRRAAAQGLASLGLAPEESPFEHADARDAMIPALEDPDAQVRMWIAQGLSRMTYAAEPAIPALVRHLTDKDEAVANWSMTALAEVGRAALPFVEKIIESGDRKRARGAAYALRRIGGPEAIRILQQGIRHADAGIRVRCMMALRDIEPRTPGALDVYRTALKETDLSILRLTLEGVLRLGRDAHPVRKAVEPLARHEDPVVRAKAQSILAATADGDGGDGSSR